MSMAARKPFFTAMTGRTHFNRACGSDWTWGHLSFLKVHGVYTQEPLEDVLQVNVDRVFAEDGNLTERVTQAAALDRQILSDKTEFKAKITNPAAAVYGSHLPLLLFGAERQQSNDMIRSLLQEIVGFNGANDLATRSMQLELDMAASRVNTDSLGADLVVSDFSFDGQFFVVIANEVLRNFFLLEYLEHAV
eukprot:TRINITY_DN680_c0_g1_i1.p1 TRINITY_DN680_c0_g1~~TRINITY_DN680_c0_g1_i1.p1  ORF type:complete len:192 (-),score=18.61 TRINITY_DN680_c0_g1_i1:365-940(-)